MTNATNYHETVADLRRCLVTAYETWLKVSDEYMSRIMEATDKETVPTSVKDARMAALMAAGYSYALAAVLKIAGDEYGEDAAKLLAFEVDEILTNGDFDNVNADVMPEPSEEQP